MAYQSASDRLQQELSDVARAHEAKRWRRRAQRMTWVWIGTAWLAVSIAVALGLGRWFRWLRD